MSDLEIMDAVIGLNKPASKTADWIVNTYLPNGPVSYRLSIEHAIANAIVEALRNKELPPRQVGIAEAAREIDELEKFVNNHCWDADLHNMVVSVDDLSEFIAKKRKAKP